MARSPSRAPRLNPDDFAGALAVGNKYKKGIATRDRVLAEAIDLFHAKGYTNASIRQLITKVGKSSSVIYNHFADKEDILFMIMRRTGEKTLGLLADVRRRHAGDPEEALRAMIRAMLHFVEHPSMVKEIAIFQNEAYHLPKKRRAIINRQYLGIVHAFEEAVAAFQRPRRRKGPGTTVAAFNVLATINWFYLWYRPKGPLGVDAIADEVTGFIFHGLA